MLDGPRIGLWKEPGRSLASCFAVEEKFLFGKQLALRCLSGVTFCKNRNSSSIQVESQESQVKYRQSRPNVKL